MDEIHTLRLAHFRANDLLVYQLADLLLIGAVVHRFHGIAPCRLTQLRKESQV